MVDQWEMCMVERGDITNNISFYTHGGYELVKQKDFIKRPHKQTGSVGNNFDQTVCLLLSEGWEPYFGYGLALYFRKKYQG